MLFSFEIPVCRLAYLFIRLGVHVHSHSKTNGCWLGSRTMRLQQKSLSGSNRIEAGHMVVWEREHGKGIGCQRNIEYKLIGFASIKNSGKTFNDFIIFCYSIWCWLANVSQVFTYWSPMFAVVLWGWRGLHGRRCVKFGVDLFLHNRLWGAIILDRKTFGIITILHGIN